MSSVSELVAELVAHWREVESARIDFWRIEGALIRDPRALDAARRRLGELSAGAEQILCDLCTAHAEEKLAEREAARAPDVDLKPQA